MKKILLSVLGVFMIGFVANAQSWNFGPKAGVSFSSINGLSGASDRVGMVAGAFAEMPVNDWFSIQTELLYSMQGFEMKADAGKDKYHLDYITMPVLTKYYLTGGLNLQLGASFGYLINAKADIAGQDKASILDETNRFNVGFITGLAYDFDCGLVVEGRYNISLVDTFRGVDANSNYRNGSLQLMVGWKF